jgi:hypothetical protein
LSESAHPLVIDCAVRIVLPYNLTVKDARLRSIHEYVLHDSPLWNITQNSNLLFRRDALGLITSVIA